jgi:hypothetical protein
MWDNEQASVTGLAEPERVESMNVTDGTLALLRVKPKLGRIFTPEDDAPGSPLTVILSEAYWQRRFGSDPKVLGRTLLVNGKSREVVGVLSEELRFLRFQPDLYLPFQFDPAEVFMGNFSYQGIARLKPGVGIAEANADVARMIPIAAEKYPRGLTLQMLKRPASTPTSCRSRRTSQATSKRSRFSSAPWAWFSHRPRQRRQPLSRPTDARQQELALPPRSAPTGSVRESPCSRA